MIKSGPPLRWARIGALVAVLVALMLSVVGVTTPAHADLPTYPAGYPKLGQDSDGKRGLSVAAGNSGDQTLLFGLEVGPTQTEYAYCVELTVSARFGSDLDVGGWDTFPGTNLFATSATARQKVTWIVYHSYPHLTLAQYRTLTGEPELSEAEAIAATQAAIWHFTDDFTYTGLYAGGRDNSSAAALRVGRVYDHLTGSANTGRAETVGPEVTVTVPTTAGQAGTKVGPIRINSSEPTATVTVTGHHPLVRADGTAVDLDAVPTGVDLYVDVPADAAADSITVTAAVTGPESTGLLVTNTDPRTQTLMIARSDQTTREAKGKITWLAQPRITTTATDLGDGDDHLPATGEVTVRDTVHYTGLIVGQTYRLEGELMVRNANGDAVATGITVSQEFTPTETSGEETLEFTVPADQLRGQVVVVFEELFHGKQSVAVHADIDDEDQTVYRPAVGTTAVDGVDGDNLLPATGPATVTDTVAYRGLKIGQEYTLRGTLMTKAADGSAVDSGISEEISFTPTTSNGTVEVTFTVPDGQLRGTTVVVFERLFLGDREVAVHTDIDDVDQTVFRPMIGTTATAEDGSKYLPQSGETTVVDTVAYAGLEPGQEYTVSGELMIRDADGNAVPTGIVATRTFTPTAPDGSIELRFTIADEELLGETVVAFESLTRDGKEVAVHADITDEGQTVRRPQLATSANDAADGDRFLAQHGPVTVVDTVSYAGLKVGETYTVNGELMERTADGPKPTGVTASATFVAEQADGTVELRFELGDADLNGTVLVAFEHLSVGDREVAAHADIDDEHQTVYRPSIDTDAYDLADGDHLLAVEGGTLRDDVSYAGLQIGRTYVVRGIVVNHDTGESTGITGETRFVATESSGVLHVDFTVPAGHARQTLVVFEWLYLVPEEPAATSRILGDDVAPPTTQQGDLLLATHTDLNAERQTVRVAAPPVELAVTGADGSLAVGLGLGGVVLLGGTALVAVGLRRRRG